MKQGLKLAFSSFATSVARWSGKPEMFALAVLSILVWLISGPFFHFSDTWQLVINTGTTIVTFLMVFLLQNSQNRESTAIQIKLDEVIRAIEGARNELVNLEDRDEDELVEMKKEFLDLAQQAQGESAS